MVGQTSLRKGEAVREGVKRQHREAEASSETTAEQVCLIAMSPTWDRSGSLIASIGSSTYQPQPEEIPDSLPIGSIWREKRRTWKEE